MKTSEFIEGNNLIAEFCDFQKTNIGWFDSESLLNIPNSNTFDDLQFHSSWDWLMPVVKKCSESFEHHQYDSEKYYHITEEIFHPDYSLSEFMDADIEAVYGRVVIYIKWYNQNK